MNHPHMPQHPGEIDTAAIALHEMFEAYLRAGFERSEAFELIKIILAGSRPSR